MTIFQKSVEQTTREYKITMVVVSLTTYLVIIAVNWGHIKRHISKRWKSGRENTPVKDNSDDAPEPAQPACPAPTSQESKTGDTEKKAGVSNEQQDIESASNGDVKRGKFWSCLQK